MTSPSSTVFQSDPEIGGGTVVFAGTRVSVGSLLDYLEAGDPLEDFPSVSQEQAEAVLGLTGEIQDEG